MGGEKSQNIKRIAGRGGGRLAIFTWFFQVLSANCQWFDVHMYSIFNKHLSKSLLDWKKTNKRIELGWFKINGGQWWDNSKWNGSICIILFEQISSKSASFRWKCHQLTNRKETIGPGQGKPIRISWSPIKKILSADIQYILMFLWAPSWSAKFHSLWFHLRGRWTGFRGRNKSHWRISSRQFDGLPRAFHEIKIDCCCTDRRSFWWFHRDGLYQTGSIPNILFK